MNRAMIVDWAAVEEVEEAEERRRLERSNQRVRVEVRRMKKEENLK